MMPLYLDYPFAVGAGGRTATTDYPDHVRDLIEQLLFTRPGERVNRPDFGCGLQDLVFEPNSAELAAVLQVSAQASLQRWLGDLITVEALSVTTEDSLLRIEVGYRFKATGLPQVTVIEPGVPS